LCGACFGCFGKVGFQFGELFVIVFFRWPDIFGLNVPAGCDYGRGKQKQNEVGEYCFIFSRHKSGPLKLCFSIYLDLSFSISAKYEDVFRLSPSFLMTVQIYAENEHFYADWSDIALD
jgi:hypothetical protein